MIRIKRADQVRHWHDIARLQAETLPTDRPCSTESGHWWLAHEGDLAVGFAGIVQSVRWADAMYLCRAGVAESHRGRGIQKRLIAVRERYARAEGKRWIVTDTTSNPQSGNSLIGRGFRLFNPTTPWGPKSALYWRKKLT